MDRRDKLEIYQVVIEYMAKHNINTIEFTYDASGDSVNDIEVSDGTKEIKLPTIISNDIFNYAWELSAADENNEGCFGVFSYNLRNGLLTLKWDNNTRIVTTQNDSGDMDFTGHDLMAAEAKKGK